MFSWPVARRELLSLRREKTIVLALVIQLFIAGFSSFLLIGLVSLYDPGSAPGGEIRIGVTGDERVSIESVIEGEGSWETVVFESGDGARGAFDRGELDAVFITQSEGDGGVEVEVVVPAESIRSTVIVVQVREALKMIEQQRRDSLASRLEHQPVTVPELPRASPTFEFFYTVLLPLLVFLPAFISGSIAVDTVTEEIDAGTLELLRVTPLSTVDIIDGKLGAMIGLVPLQVTAWLWLLHINGATISHPVMIVLFGSFIAILVVTLGGVVAVALKDRQSAQLVYSFGIIILFLTASVLPESPPNIIAKFAVNSETAVTVGSLLGYGGAAGLLYVACRRYVAQSIRS